MKIWINNTEGKPDAVLTLTILSFVFVMIKFLIAGASIAIGDVVYSAGPIGADEIAAILTPTLGSYVARRWTDRKFATPVPIVVQEPIVDDKEDARESLENV